MTLTPGLRALHVPHRDAAAGASGWLDTPRLARMARPSHLEITDQIARWTRPTDPCGISTPVTGQGVR